MAMRYPIRKLLGTIGLLALLVVYSLLVTAFAASSLPGMGTGISAMFYLIAGVGWVPVAMVIVSWMYKRDRSAPPPA